uniref:Type II secretory pathway, component ExeA (Predicted ATPase) n=1 Tax=Candidatus Kentrum sp. LPFa TaxID=2126335 RepID=A0A450WD99_9GAMM|nr:MAG: Type II secretory pathway, component ExeA (predicted ATPase) [Candidatus Kentron sp. LPFa]
MLKLKNTLAEYGIAQREMAREIGISPAGVSQIICHGQWPRRRDVATLQSGILEFLRARGVSERRIRKVFDESGPGRTNDPAPRTQQEGEENMLLRKQTLFPERETLKHFGLFRDPFTEDVNAQEDIYLDDDIRYAREALYSVARHGGFLALTGDSGAGKSTLRRDLIDRLARENQPVVVIFPYVLGMVDNAAKGKTLRAAHIEEAILHAVSPLARPRQSAQARARQVHQALRDSHRTGKHHVLILEEAHSLYRPTLRHLKDFLELEEGFTRLLSIILIGQSELKMKLSENDFEMRQVVGRCQMMELAPLDASLADYLGFKFRRVGAERDRIIDEGGIATLATRLGSTTRGFRGQGAPVSSLYPLAVGNLLTASMNLAAELGANPVTADIVKEV